MMRFCRKNIYKVIKELVRFAKTVVFALIFSVGTIKEFQTAVDKHLIDCRIWSYDGYIWNFFVKKSFVVLVFAADRVP